MTIKLFIQAVSKFLLGIILVALLIYLPAGTINYFNGWLFMGGIVYSDVNCWNNYDD